MRISNGRKNLPFEFPCGILECLSKIVKILTQIMFFRSQLMNTCSKPLYRAFLLILIFAFISSSLYVPQANADMPGPWAQEITFPDPGTRIDLSPNFIPAQLKGITIHPENPLMFDFIIYKGDKVLSNEQKQEEYKRLVKYFLASLAIPDEDQWVTY
jgi:hypothetical protein